MLSTISPAPISTPSASATSAATSRWRSRPLRALVPRLRPSCNPCWASPFIALSALARPKSTPGQAAHRERERQHRAIQVDVVQVAERNLPQTVGQPVFQQSNAACRYRQSGGSAQQRKQHALGQQLAHDAQRPAPNARLTANSLRRAAPRASIMLATFTQAINRTNPTAANRA